MGHETAIFCMYQFDEKNQGDKIDNGIYEDTKMTVSQ